MIVLKRGDFILVKKIKPFFIVIMMIVAVLSGTATFSYANESVSTENKVEASLKLDGGMVDYPIEQVKSEKDYALEKTDEYYLINHIESKKEVLIQITDEDTAYELGFKDDVLKAIEQEDKVDFGYIPNNKPVVILGERENGFRYKQVIAKEEVDVVKEAIKDKKEKTSSLNRKPTKKVTQIIKDNIPFLKKDKSTSEKTRDKEKTSKEDLEKEQENDLKQGFNSGEEKSSFLSLTSFIIIFLIIMSFIFILFFIFWRRKKDEEDKEESEESNEQGEL